MAIRGSVVLLALLPLPAFAGEPSFDCRTQRGPAEKAICASAQLSALDVKIADVYGRVRAGLTATGREVLKSHQVAFLAARDRSAEASGGRELAGLLGEQLTFLRTVDTRPRGDIGGVWRNALGSVTVTTTGGRTAAAASTAEPTSGRWVCDVEGEVETTATGRVVRADDGVNIRLVTHEGVLRVTTVATRGGDPTPAFCGHGGTIDGDYLPVME